MNHLKPMQQSSLIQAAHGRVPHSRSYRRELLTHEMVLSRSKVVRLQPGKAGLLYYRNPQSLIRTLALTAVSRQHSNGLSVLFLKVYAVMARCISYSVCHGPRRAHRRYYLILHIIGGLLSSVLLCEAICGQLREAAEPLQRRLHLADHQPQALQTFLQL